MPSNTKYNPLHVDEFEKTKLNFNAHGVNTTVVLGTTANLDYTLTDDCLITGAELIVNGGNYGDTLNLQVVDLSGAFTGTPGTVVNQFATNWNAPPQCDTQFDTAYPAKIYAGLTLRLVYTSTGLGVTPVFLAVNWKLHKVLM
jgi:hypothetical protein